MLTKAQQKAIHSLYQRNPNGAANYLEFRRRFHQSTLMDCVLGQWCAMLIGIETDEYTHS